MISFMFWNLFTIKWIFCKLDEFSRSIKWMSSMGTRYYYSSTFWHPNKYKTTWAQWLRDEVVWATKEGTNKPWPQVDGTTMARPLIDNWSIHLGCYHFPLHCFQCWVLLCNAIHQHRRRMKRFVLCKHNIVVRWLLSFRVCTC